MIQGSHKNNKDDEVTEDGDFITGLDTRSNKANDSIDSLNRQHTWIERMANRKSIIELIHGPKLSRRDSVVVYGKTFLIDNEFTLENSTWSKNIISICIFSKFSPFSLPLFNQTGLTHSLRSTGSYIKYFQII